MIRIKTAFFFLFIGYLTGCSPEKQEKKAEVIPEKTVNQPKADTVVALEQYLIKPGKAGQLEIGMPVEILKKLIAPENLVETKQELEGIKTNVYEIRNAKAGNQLLLKAEESCKNSCIINRIRILNPKFQTRDSIRVGSTFGEVQRKYPLSFIGIGKANFVAVSEINKMTFTLDISGFPPKPLYKIKAADIPEDTPVTGILLY